MAVIRLGRLILGIAASLGAVVALVAAVLALAWITQPKPAELSDALAARQVHGPPVLERGLVTWRALDATSDEVRGNVRNIAPSPLRNVSAQVFVHNQNAIVVAMQIAHVDPPVLAPRQIGSYRVVLKHDPAARSCLVDFVDGKGAYLIDRDIRMHQ